MALYDDRTPLSRYVGDNKTLIFFFRNANGQDVRDLTGWAGGVTFWHPGFPPHVERAGKIDGPNGTLTYLEVGDEYDSPGDILAQPTIMLPIRAGAPYFFQDSREPVRIIVKARP